MSALIPLREGPAQTARGEVDLRALVSPSPTSCVSLHAECQLPRPYKSLIMNSLESCDLTVGLTQILLPQNCQDKGWSYRKDVFMGSLQSDNAYMQGHWSKCSHMSTYVQH